MVLKEITKNESKPKVICVETVSYSHVGLGMKNDSMIRSLEQEGVSVLC